MKNTGRSNSNQFLAEKLESLLSIFFNCERIIFSLAWFTLALGSLIEELSIDFLWWSSWSSYLDLLTLIEELANDLFILLLSSEDCPIASATSLTGKLKAAKYSFLDSTSWEWALLISSKSLIYSYSKFLSSFFLFYFSFIALTKLCACSVYNAWSFSFQYFWNRSFACCDSSATFFFFSFWADWNYRYISLSFLLCSIETFLTSLASSSLTR